MSLGGDGQGEGGMGEICNSVGNNKKIQSPSTPQKGQFNIAKVATVCMCVHARARCEESRLQANEEA